MLKSMTGYGYGAANGFGRKFTVEMKAVNNRFCDVALRLPRFLMVLEDQIKKLIQSQVTRGRVDCFLSVEKTMTSVTNTVKVDKELASAYYKAIRELQEDLGVDSAIKISYLTSLPGVLSLEEAEEDAREMWPVIKEALDAALTGLLNMRITEGEKLGLDFRKRLGRIAGHNDGIKSRAPAVLEDYREKLLTRLQEYVGDDVMDPARLTAEIAIFADRSDITEEIVRIESHISQMIACFDEDEATGRKLDFLSQEMHREINTIGAKANDLEIGKLVIALKSELERVREQVQNIE